LHSCVVFSQWDKWCELASQLLSIDRFGKRLHWNAGGSAAAAAAAAGAAASAAASEFTRPSLRCLVG
jgi:hypothetical protein